MKKISFFGLVIAFMTTAIFIVSCSQPLFPDGSTYPAGSEYDWNGEDIPGWNTDGRMTVAQQLGWLRDNAPAGTHWNVWAWMRAPYETIDASQDIHGVGGAAITVNLRTYSGYEGLANRRTLQLAEGIFMSMLNVQGDNTLILGNIILQGRSSGNSAALVDVNAGTLEKRNYSEIRGHTGFDHTVSVGVGASAGATFTMRGNSWITGNTVGVIVDGAVFYMRANARITSNNDTGVKLRDNGTLRMFNYANISGNATFGLHSIGGSRIFMNNDARIGHNGRVRNFFGNYGNQNGGVYLNSSYLIMRNNAQIYSNFVGVFMTGSPFLGSPLSRSQLSMYEYAAIHNNIGSGVRGLYNSHVYMYRYASIRNNNAGGVRLETLGANSLNMHGYARIFGNNVTEVGLFSGGGGVNLGSAFNNYLNISGGTIYGRYRYTNPTPTLEDPNLANIAEGGWATFHTLRSPNGISVGTYVPGPDFGTPGNFTPFAPPVSTVSNTNNTVRVRNNGAVHNSAHW